MRRFWWRPTALILACIALVWRSLATEVKLDSKDKGFIKSAYENGLFEIQMGTLGKDKSAEAQVRALGELLISHHANANEEIKTLAASKQVELASKPALLGKGIHKLLEMKSGVDFDKAFVARTLDDQRKAVLAFESIVNKTNDADLKTFANKMLPAVRRHVSMAEELQRKQGK